MISIERQIEAMVDQWPRFTVTTRTGQSATWEGTLAPDKRAYRIRIHYRVPHLLENLTAHDVQPRVQVLSPVLERHPDYELGPLPHVYLNRTEPSLPYLCLFSPELREWHTGDLIAETTVFWTAEWLYFYEGWLVTKKWHGGGRHPIRVADGTKRLEAV